MCCLKLSAGLLLAELLVFYVVFSDVFSDEETAGGTRVEAEFQKSRVFRNLDIFF